MHEGKKEQTERKVLAAEEKWKEGKEEEKKDLDKKRRSFIYCRYYIPVPPASVSFLLAAAREDTAKEEAGRRFLFLACVRWSSAS